MTNPVDQFKKMAEDNPYPSARACCTCKFYKQSSMFSWCLFYGGDIRCAVARETTHLCGLNGKNWQPIPPRLGLFGWIRRLLFGDRK